MFSYNNTHIFTGYLKQMLSYFNLPSCKVYTHEYAAYFEQHGEEDPRVLESFDSCNNHGAVRINYLKNNDLYNYFLDESGKAKWKRSADIFYSPDKAAHGLTRSLNSVGKYYDTITHEYLGDYLRFVRDYYNLNLMSMYNCFNNKIYNNIYFNFIINPDADKNQQVKVTFDSQDSSYKIYAIPVKLFSQYTIALDCSQGIEMFCGLYNTRLELSAKANILAAKTYVKINQTLFNQPFLYDKLNINNWRAENDIDIKSTQQSKLQKQPAKFSPAQVRSDIFTRWDITNREKDLRLFIKVPISCKSSIVVLEGDYRGYNDAKYSPAKKTIAGSSSLEKTTWNYSQNHTMLNFNTTRKGVRYNTASGEENFGDGIDLNEYYFKPISKLQLLAFNTGESYPFADRLVEYLSGSAITQMDEIPDNIKRVQRVMAQNKNYSKIEGLWENKIQNILYDYMMNSGPIIIGDDKLLVDKRTGTHPTLGYTTKSTIYDILGYADKDTEKLYASWKRENGRAVVKDTIQNVDVYDGLYDI